MEAPSENRALTVGVVKRLGLFPLDARHFESRECFCERCVRDDGGELLPAVELARLQHLARKRQVVKQPWDVAA